MPEQMGNTDLANLIAVLADEAARSPEEVLRRCGALERLSSYGGSAADALPAIMRSLLVRVTVDCGLVLRVAAAEAVWKVGERRDLAEPFLTWALKDEDWGASRKAAEVLTEMGNVAHRAVPDLVNLAERRLDRGPFNYERLGNGNGGESLLTVIAKALGVCGRGIAHVDQARRILTRIADGNDADACAAAERALTQLQDVTT
jgi:hypothetical protein